MSNKIYLPTRSPKIAAEWHPLLNGDLTPDQFTCSSKNRVWWLCDYGHEWQSTIINRVHNKTGCPYCTHQKLCVETSLAYVCPNLIEEWHPLKNGDLSPHSVFAKTRKKIWWICKKGHEWQTTIGHRVNGSGCPFCSNKKICLSNSLFSLNKKISNEWHYAKNFPLTPQNVSLKSSKRVTWMCEKGHEWKTSVRHRTVSKSGCPFCPSASKGEICIENIIKKFNLPYFKQYVFKDCRGRKRPLPFDFLIYIHNLQIAIEFNGRQHYTPIYGNKSFYETTKNDAIKMQYCASENIPLLIIPHWNFSKMEHIISNFIAFYGN